MKLVEKPWGCEKWWAQSDRYIGKILEIKCGHRLSLQYHEVKEETIIVLSGVLTLVVGDDVRTLHPWETAHIAPRVIHRMEANDGDVQLIEVSTPEVDDIVRLSDDYKRR